MHRILARLHAALGNNGSTSNVMTADLRALLAEVENARRGAGGNPSTYTQHVDEFETLRRDALKGLVGG